MPAYATTPLVPVALALPGTPVYVWGSYADRVSPTRFVIRDVEVTSDVAKLTGYITEGEIPAVGSLVTVRGTSAASGAFNVSAVALTDVTIASTGIGTLSYALSNADVTQVANPGLAIVPPPVVYEAVSTNDYSAAVALPMSQDGKALTGFSAEIVWNPTTSAGGVDVQVSDDNANGGNYVTVSSIIYPATRFDPAGLSANFVRLQLTTALVDATTIAGRILAR